MSNEKIWINNQTEMQTVLQVLSKKGYSWRSGKKPEEFSPVIPVAIILSDDGKINWQGFQKEEELEKLMFARTCKKVTDFVA